jgi:predicted dehydrogenase
MAKELGLERRYASVAELARDPEVEAVFVCSVNSAHLQDVLAVAAAGKAVLCEKPMGLDAGECERMVRACRASRVRLFAGHSIRFSPFLEKVRTVLDEGKIGALRSMRAYYSSLCPPGVWRRDGRLSGGGPLMDLGPHLIDTFRVIARDEVQWVLGSLSPLPEKEGGQVEEQATAILGFSGGMTAVMEVSFIEPFRNHFEISGSAGALRADYAASLIANENVKLALFSSDPHPPKVEILPLPTADFYLDQIEDVSMALRDPTHQARCATGEDALAAALVTDAIYQSARSGGKVVLNG